MVKQTLTPYFDFQSGLESGSLGNFEPNGQSVSLRGHLATVIIMLKFSLQYIAIWMVYCDRRIVSFCTIYLCS